MWEYPVSAEFFEYADFIGPRDLREEVIFWTRHTWVDTEYRYVNAAHDRSTIVDIYDDNRYLGINPEVRHLAYGRMYRP